MALVAALISLLVPLTIVAFKGGDPLYLGSWYYLAVPMCVIGAAALVRPGGWFLAGVSVALSISFVIYQWVQITAQRPEGLLGLGHAFSMPGPLIAALGAALLARVARPINPLGLFLIGFCASAAGFMVAQTIVCNTLMYCGALTF